jgi:hypothetical protein
VGARGILKVEPQLWSSSTFIILARDGDLKLLGKKEKRKGC